ncbi:MAG: hypothetical protein ABEK00_03195 [Candidatus Nanohaloarchaea archaeon]
MVKNKALALLVTGFFLVGGTSAISLHVSIDSITKADVKNVQYQNSTSINDVNTSIMNTGSIGCQYRLKMAYSYRNKTYSSYSSNKALWPGSSELAELKAPVFNYTGPVNSTLYVEFCDQTKKVADFTFNSTENITINNTLDSTTVKASSRQAKIQLDVQEGVLIPIDTPAYWKASSVEIENGSATVEYQAPIFDSDENLTYMVKHGDQILGKTKVELKAQKTLLDTIMSVNRKLLYGLIALLAALNLFLLQRTLTNRN